MKLAILLNVFSKIFVMFHKDSFYVGPKGMFASTGDS